MYWAMSLRSPDVKLNELARVAERHRLLRHARRRPSAPNSSSVNQAMDSETKHGADWLRLPDKAPV
jgi:hypothetical protein